MAEASIKHFVAMVIVGLALVIASVIGIRAPQSKLQRVPDLALQIIDGSKINLRSLSGNPVLVTFWATSCKPCIKKTPELKALYQRLKPRGFELIAVAMAYDPPNRILAFAKDNKIPYPIALDLDGAVARAFEYVTLTPTTFLIAPNGDIVFSKVGNLDIELMAEKISSLLLDKNRLALNAAS